MSNTTINTATNTATIGSTSSVDFQQNVGNPRAAHFSIMELVAEIIKIDDTLRDTENQYSIEQQLSSFNESMDAINAQKSAAEKHKTMGMLDGIGSIVSGGVSLGLMGAHSGAERGFKYKFQSISTKEGKFQLPVSKNAETPIRKAAEIDLTNAMSSKNLEALKRGDEFLGAEKKIRVLNPDDIKAKYTSATNRSLDEKVHSKLAEFTEHPDVLGQLIGSAGPKIASTFVAKGASSDERLADFDKSIEKYFDKDADSFSQKARSVSSEMRQAINSLVQIEGKLCDAINIR